MNDEEILELYFRRSSDAIKITKEKYERLCMSVSLNILNNEEDAKEILNDTLMALWQSIPPKKPSSLKTYICKTAKNLSLKKYEYTKAKKRNSEYDKSFDELRECISANNFVEDAVETKELSKAINRFLHNLSKEKRIMFLRRYYLLNSVKEIAADYSISEKNASAKLARLRYQLKEFLTKEGYINE